MIKICVSGSKGKMGSRIIELAKDDPELEVAGQFDVGEDAAENIKRGDCLIEFTAPKATLEHLAICEAEKKAIVIGTTGLSEAEKGKIKEASKNIAVVFSPNMSIAVNLLFRLIETASKVLGPDYDVGILEAHHVHKKDAPSGTAKELARIIKEARANAHVPIESVREDEIVGEHTVTFESPYDLLEITHSAKSRDILAKGALTAAKFVVKKANGLFSMQDVLGI
ncbi:MAG: 4-hydroxy-tetrahydrodipicolinate reductase [Candidatus Omnitrophica bacterium]|nr:4-hydroxy-tetrahydrodipicolinate reductase [Candidatus Omnitrophota bacterium]